jgi:hypothetical protein
LHRISKNFGLINHCLVHRLSHHVLKWFRIICVGALFRRRQRTLLEYSTFSLTVWCQTKLFIMSHVSFELSFVCIFQLILGNCLDILWINFMRTALRRLCHCWLFRVPPGVSKVCWRENRTSPPRAASPVCSEACQPIEAHVRKQIDRLDQPIVTSALE